MKAMNWSQPSPNCPANPRNAAFSSLLAGVERREKVRERKTLR